MLLCTGHSTHSPTGCMEDLFASGSPSSLRHNVSPPIFDPNQSILLTVFPSKFYCHGFSCLLSVEIIVVIVQTLFAKVTFIAPGVRCLVDVALPKKTQMPEQLNSFRLTAFPLDTLVTYTWLDDLRLALFYFLLL